MKRALLIVLDSVGIGHAPDADFFGDAGSNTLGHIRERAEHFSIPNLDAAGMAHAEALAAGHQPPETPTRMAWGCLTEQSAGKDTTTGHWEIAGAKLTESFATFEKFPPSLVKELEKAAGVRFIGNYARSGTVILEELGEEHLNSGKPILYTSSDSVIQIAAHENVIPLEQLYEICSTCREIADRERIGRVIARPFTGHPGNFERTSNRRDFSLEPPRTVLNALFESGVHTVGIGKISDIFAGSGIANSFPTKSNQKGMEIIQQLWQEPVGSPTLYFANLVDFDMLFGHRRDVQGYANALQEFDHWLGEFLPLIDDSESLFLITADHGNDPTWSGTDHTRERVPLLASGPLPPASIGCRDQFSDIAATLSEYFELDEWPEGRSILGDALD
ncbi:MAG: phosphopentomutase [Verrucomicrobiales bacterium]|nr:phosphopentomutase [Verrucomicrobiales bacterium]